MSLVEVTSFVGGSEIHDGLPLIEIPTLAIYVPFDPKVFFDRDQTWGIYNEDGSIIKSAAYLRGDPPELIGQSWHSSESFTHIEEATDHKYIYAGPLIPHYGHFLISSLSRLWPLLTKGLDGTKILFHAYGDPQGWFKTPYVSETLGALGITPNECATFSSPVKIKSLVIPKRSFGEQAFAYPVFVDLCHKIGSLITEGTKGVSDHRPIYLSKTRLNNGVGRLRNEGDLIKSIVKKVEIEVVYPEELSIKDQIRLFTSGRLVVGTTSSAFHTSIFSSTVPNILGISFRSSVPSNYKMIDDINGNRATYLFPKDGFKKFDPDRNFNETFEISDPEVLAAELVPFIKTKSRMNPMESRSVVALPGSEQNTKGLCVADENHQGEASLPWTVPDHQGSHYQSVLGFLHERLSPKSYLEIGTLKGETLALAKCASIAIDPALAISDPGVIGSKPTCCFFQMKSDDFFSQYDPKQILGRHIDFAFLDGMHRCEFLLRDFINTEAHCKVNSIIALHDCLPLEPPMAERDQGHPAILPHRRGWWTGDVWRTVVALKKHRPDLSISALDAGPTGLILVTNLDPTSTVLGSGYAKLVEEMLSLSLEEDGITDYFSMVNLESTSAIMSDERLTRRFWL